VRAALRVNNSGGGGGGGAAYALSRRIDSAAAAATATTVARSPRLVKAPNEMSRVAVPLRSLDSFMYIYIYIYVSSSLRPAAARIVPRHSLLLCVCVCLFLCTLPTSSRGRVLSPPSPPQTHLINVV